jgi:hypothetical protein
MTTTTAIEPTVQITVDAHAASIAWQNAALSMGDAKEKPILFKNISLEFYEGRGIQFIATDGTILLRTWVPAHDSRKLDWPVRRPDRSVVVMDRDGFALGFMKTLQRAAKEDTYEPLVVAIEAKDEDGQQPLSKEFAPYVLRLTACGQQLTLPLMQEEYPDWRQLNLGIAPDERIEGLTIAPRMFATLGKIKTASKIDVQFLGEQKQIAVRAFDGAMPVVEGILMPMQRVEAEKTKREKGEGQVHGTVSINGGPEIDMDDTEAVVDAAARAFTQK